MSNGSGHKFCVCEICRRRTLRENNGVCPRCAQELRIKELGDREYRLANKGGMYEEVSL